MYVLFILITFILKNEGSSLLHTKINIKGITNYLIYTNKNPLTLS